MDEKNLLNKIAHSAEEIDVPESLSPERIEMRIEGRNYAAVSEKVVWWRRRGIRIAEVAAAVVLVFAAGYQIGFSGRPSGNLTLALPETEMQTGSGAQTEGESSTDEEEKVVSDADRGMATAQTSEASGDIEQDTAEDTAAQSEPKRKTKQESTQREEGFAPIGSEEALYEKLSEYQNENNNYLMRDGVMEIAMDVDEMGAVNSAQGTADMAEEEITAETAALTDSAAGSGDFSQTNLRELGVDEGDIVKTDGKYIYIMKRNSSIEIVGADGEKLTHVRSVVPENLNETVRDMYVDGSILTLITGGSKSSMVMSTEGGGDTAETSASEQDVYTMQVYNYAKVLTIDISDPANPQILGSVEQEGYYHSSRKVGDDIYLFTQYQPQIGSTPTDSAIMPLVNGVPLGADNIYVPETLENTSYLVIGSVNLNEPDKAVAHKAVVSGVNHFYVSKESIFICTQSWRDGNDTTDILKFSYKNGDIWGVGACSLPGYLNDTFSLDEYNGYLRVVATNWNSGDEINALYVYDEHMELVGKIDDIAPGETIRSARFLGDIGYFVTFKQTDPLFSVDLSDPKNPQILGALKVSGFSSYLHFYGENRLLGIGYDADDETGMTTGIKLSMFDVSDPANVTETKRYIIKDASYCPGLSNYRAIMINPEKNLFGFVCDNNYLVFTYDEENGFTNLLTYNMSGGTDQVNYWYAFDDVRGLYIADTFYLADADTVRAFDITADFEQRAKLEL